MSIHSRYEQDKGKLVNASTCNFMVVPTITSTISHTRHDRVLALTFILRLPWMPHLLIVHKDITLMSSIKLRQKLVGWKI